jgi:hypothetical protein
MAAKNNKCRTSLDLERWLSWSILYEKTKFLERSGNFSFRVSGVSFFSGCFYFLDTLLCKISLVPQKKLINGTVPYG